jgi:hypothetical protein
MLTNWQIAKLDEIALECYERNEFVRQSLSATDFEDWACALDRAEMYDLADRVRGVMTS